MQFAEVLVSMSEGKSYFAKSSLGIVRKKLTGDIVWAHDDKFVGLQRKLFEVGWQVMNKPVANHEIVPKLEEGNRLRCQHPENTEHVYDIIQTKHVLYKTTDGQEWEQIDKVPMKDIVTCVWEIIE